jgi:outer membrane biosynthesis protein TonB
MMTGWRACLAGPAVAGASLVFLLGVPGTALSVPRDAGAFVATDRSVAEMIDRILAGKLLRQVCRRTATPLPTPPSRGPVPPSAPAPPSPAPPTRNTPPPPREPTTTPPPAPPTRNTPPPPRAAAPPPPILRTPPEPAPKQTQPRTPTPTRTPTSTPVQAPSAPKSPAPPHINAESARPGTGTSLIGRMLLFIAPAVLAAAALRPRAGSGYRSA